MREIITKNKDFLLAIVLSFAVSFNIFLYEPLTMYANNIDDFWFDLYTLFGPTLLLFFTTFSLILFVFFIIYMVATKINHPNIYYILISISSFCFICLYIHSNFLTSFLPSLDGETISWNDPTANTISIITCLVITVICIISFIKFKPRKTALYCAYAICAIFAMLFVSLSSTLFSTDIFLSKDIIANSTDKNINLISNNNNYLVFLVDAVDSVNFNKIVNSNTDYQKTLKDFSYFPDTVSGYAFTRDSIPFIFSGEWNENKVPFPEYSTNAFDKSRFFNKLSENDYNKNFYDSDFTWNSTKALEFDNIISAEKNPKKLTLLKQEVKYYLYKSLPFPLKQLSNIENLDFAATQPPQEYSRFNWTDLYFYNNYLEQPLTKTDQNYFQYVHLEGGHTPFNVSKDITEIPNNSGTYEGSGTYEEKLEATMKVISAYLQRLKDNDAYNNATIVILADHGYWHTDSADRSNPILYVKGRDEKHSQINISDKQVSYADLCNMFIELLDGKSSTEIFSDIPTKGRVRRYLFNTFNHEEHMEEYEQTDKAWNYDTLKPTGRTFDL